MNHYTLFSKDDNQRIEKIHHMSLENILFSFENDSTEPGDYKVAPLKKIFALDLDLGKKIDDLLELNLPFQILYDGKVILNSIDIMVNQDEFARKFMELSLMVKFRGNILN